jgi:hypothetical protein
VQQPHLLRGQLAAHQSTGGISGGCHKGIGTFKALLHLLGYGGSDHHALLHLFVNKDDLVHCHWTMRGVPVIEAIFQMVFCLSMAIVVDGIHHHLTNLAYG